MFTLPYGQHRFTNVWCLDSKDDGGAHHEYVVTDVEETNEAVALGDCAVFASVSFQKGPVKEAGKNGCFMEDLLHICQHRLECFQAGPFACQENAEALDYITKALEALNRRTRSRQQRGVEGANQL